MHNNQEERRVHLADTSVSRYFPPSVDHECPFPNSKELALKMVLSQLNSAHIFTPIFKDQF